MDYSLFEDLFYPELWFVNSLKLKASRDMVYNAIAKSNRFLYDSDREVFLRNALREPNKILIMGYTVDGQDTFASP